MSTDLATILGQALLLLGVCIFVLSALRRLHMPPVIGYLCIGMLLAPYASSWVVLEPLAEIGLVLLLFTIGLEVSPARLRGLRAELWGMGGAQVLISTASGMLIALWFGIPWQGALVLGGAMAMSSTAIVLGQLGEQLELRHAHGRLAFSVLLFQDLAAVLLLALIPAFAGSPDGDTIGSFLEILLKGLLAMVLVLASAHWVMRPILEGVARTRSSEIFTLSALFAALTAAWLAQVNGLSAALGAVLAGILFSDTQYRYQIENDLRPFRDVLMGVFFISIGMHLDVGVIPRYWPWLLLLLPGIIIGKGLLISGLALLRHHAVSTALRLGMVLSQGGELGLALVFLALKHEVVTLEHGQPIIAAIVLTMLCAPLLVRHNRLLEKLLLHYAPHLHTGTQPPAPAGAGHVLLCGFGHVGQNIAGVLQRGGVPYTALESNPTIVREAREAGEPVLFGDGSQARLLEAAGLREARALAVTFRDFPATLKTIREARRQCPKLPIAARCGTDQEVRELLELGVQSAVPEHAQSGALLATHLLHHYGVAPSSLWELMRECSEDGYQELRGFSENIAKHAPQGTGRPPLHILHITSGNPAVGLPLVELLPSGGAVRARGLLRADRYTDSPTPSQRLEPEDILLLEGGTQAIEELQRRFAAFSSQGKPQE